LRIAAHKSAGHDGPISALFDERISDVLDGNYRPAINRTVAVERAVVLAHEAMRLPEACRIWEYRLHGRWSVAMDALEPSVLGETLRRLDDLLAEARMLRERITAAIRREREPFFPERRRHDEPHTPERRQQ